jgi:predicted AAA+ superfamily ATPase
MLLEQTYVIRRLPPFHRSVRKEVSKARKVYFEDSGLLNILLNRGFSSVLSGPLFENSVFSQLRKVTGIEGLYYWRTTADQEIDFIIEQKGPVRRVQPLEVKLSFPNRPLSSLESFRESYQCVSPSICSLHPEQAQSVNGIAQLYPWNIESYL